MKVDLKILQGSAWLEADSKNEWDVAYGEGGTMGEDPYQSCVYLGPTGGRVLQKNVLLDPRFGELCKLVVSSPDIEKRKPYAQEMHRILFEKTWYIPFTIMEDIFGIDARLEGFVAPKSRNTRIFENILDDSWKS